ncbi:MAG TPA: TRAP transporter small permease subunit, partial [Steroidobacteraceae bacterium]|nr:TRAP transporter small permease subunit [Steroidobacteraceae bacterium]
MTALLTLCRWVDRLSTLVGQSVSWLILAAILISAGNAVVRKAFHASSNAWLELQWYLFAAVFLLAAAHTLLRGEHVKVDLIYTKLSPRSQIWIEVFGTLFFLLPFCIITIGLTWPLAWARYVNGEMSSNAGGLILWPVWMLIPAGFGLLA